MHYILAMIMGYLLGCSSMAYYISRLRNTDIRKAGSGNLGASNATVLFGWGAGVAVAVHDIGKAMAAVLLAKWLFPEAEFAGAVAGIACVMGHIFPFYLKFKGGKGLASYIGVAIALNWKMALVVVIVLVAATVLTDFISVGTMSVVTVAPVYAALISRNLVLAGILLAGTLVMYAKHWENVVRIAKGQEIGLRSTIRGENRIDKK